MKTKAAVCPEVGAAWSIEEIELSPPGPNDVVVKMAYAGMCHSDEHLRDGSIGAPEEVIAQFGSKSLYPVIGGHEGAGVVVEAGDRVTTVSVGDHVAVSFVPSCGRCFWCVTGRQNLCDRTAATLAGPMITDGVWRHHRLDGSRVNRMGQLGTFSDHILCDELSLIQIEPDLPLKVAAVISCGIATGFGSSVNRAQVRPGEVAIVIGCGGVGHGALLGAVSAGARAVVAVDPVAFKRESAESIGATHLVESMEEAFPLVTQLTRGQMADVAVLTPSRLEGDMVAPALSLISKDGRLVCTALQRWNDVDVKISLYELAMFNKALLGSQFGSASPRASVLSLLDLYKAGKLPLDALITNEYELENLGDGYDDLLAGRNIRGVVRFDG